MISYTYIFFDLDHTLWDFERSSAETLSELLPIYSPKCEVTEFIKAFSVVNNQLWNLYHKNQITKDNLRKQRFSRVYEMTGAIPPKEITQMAVEYQRICPQKPYLIPNALIALDYLKNKYRLAVLSNGFEDVIYTKLHSSKLIPYFDFICMPSIAGYKKPHKKIFLHALEMAQCEAKEAIMIGDNLLIDVIGARNAGVAQIFYNPEKIRHKYKITHEIETLNELTVIL